MDNQVFVKQAVLQEMISHSAGVYPEEGCGFLAGDNNRILDCFPVENRLHSRTAFEMDPTRQIDTFWRIEEGEYQCVGIFHSHPLGPDLPSRHDSQQLTYPHLLHVIVSLVDIKKPVVRVFRWCQGSFREQMVRIL